MPKIIVYSTPVCAYCKQAKAFFEEHHLSYEEKDVASDAAARNEMLNKSHQMGVPVIDIDGTIMVGFERSKLTELIKVK